MMYRSATRKELADAAGVSVKTLTKWLRPIMPVLKQMGYRRKVRIFTPAMTRVICEHLSIEMGADTS